MTSTPPARLSFSNPWFYSLLACFLLAFLFGTRLINDSDMGFHLRCGKEIIQNHFIPSVDTFTYTVPGNEYLDMEWLYQAFLYLGYLIGGYSLLSLSHTGLVLLALALLWIRLRSIGIPNSIGVLLFTAALLASETRFRVRPEVLTWVLMGLTFWILETRADRGRKFLFLLPVIQLFWVNTEGLFFLGLVSMGAYVLSDLTHHGRVDPKLLKFSWMSAGACLLNPHFFKGFFFPVSFLSSLGSSSIYKYTIAEFQSPWTPLGPSLGAEPPFLILYKTFGFFLLFLFLADFKKRKIHEWLLALFFFGLSFSAVRNVPLFMLACAPLAAAIWKDSRWGWIPKFQVLLETKPYFAWGLTLFLLGLSLRVITGAHYVSHRSTDRFGLGLDQQALPVKACEFLNQNHLTGKILNTLDFGDWLDWRGPQKTFIDGRLDVMGLELFTDYTNSLLPGGLDPLLSKFRPEIIFFNPLLGAQWLTDFKGRPNWRLIYLDESSAIALRAGYRDEIPSLDYEKLLADHGVLKAFLSNPESILSAPPPSGWGSFLSDLLKPTEYQNGLLNLGIFCGYAGHFGEAELFFLEGIRRTHGRYYDYFYNLGLLYYYEGKKDLAALCVKRVLRERPDDPGALQALQSLGK